MENTCYYRILSAKTNDVGLKDINNRVNFYHCLIDYDAIVGSDFNFNLSTSNIFKAKSNDYSYFYKNGSISNSRISYFFDSLPEYKEINGALFECNLNLKEDNSLSAFITPNEAFYGNRSSSIKLNTIKNALLELGNNDLIVNIEKFSPKSENNNSSDISKLVGTVSTKDMDLKTDDFNINLKTSETSLLDEDNSIKIIFEDSKYKIKAANISELNFPTYFGFAIKLEEFSEINDGNNGVAIEALSSGHTKIYCDELVEIGE